MRGNTFDPPGKNKGHGLQQHENKTFADFKPFGTPTVEMILEEKNPTKFKLFQSFFDNLGFWGSWLSSLSHAPFQAHPLQALSSRLRFATEAPSWARQLSGQCLKSKTVSVFCCLCCGGLCYVYGMKKNVFFLFLFDLELKVFLVSINTSLGRGKLFGLQWLTREAVLRVYHRFRWFTCHKSFKIGCGLQKDILEHVMTH